MRLASEIFLWFQRELRLRGTRYLACKKRTKGICKGRRWRALPPQKGGSLRCQRSCVQAAPHRSIQGKRNDVLSGWSVGIFLNHREDEVTFIKRPCSKVLVIVCRALWHGRYCRDPFHLPCSIDRSPAIVSGYRDSWWRALCNPPGRESRWDPNLPCV